VLAVHGGGPLRQSKRQPTHTHENERRRTTISERPPRSFNRIALTSDLLPTTQGNFPLIQVTKPYLPPMEEYLDVAQGIWDRCWLTNDGPLLKEYELRLKDFLALEGLVGVSSGTMAIQLAIKALGLSGEIVTTPFSYVASTSAITWQGCEAVHADIDPLSLNIDPERIEEAITERTTGILATHCFGNPADIAAISEVAERHDLKVIYDAAHCFGSTYKGESVLNYGDVSAISLHATKVVHCVEGGLVVTRSEPLLRKLSLLRNFGHDGPEKFTGEGINGKVSEFHAAMGLCVLTHAPELLESRRRQAETYDDLLSEVRHAVPPAGNHTEPNRSYYPVIFESERATLEIKAQLETNGVGTRRYFYPSLSSLDYVTNRRTPVADEVCRRILCLPMYHGLRRKDQVFIARAIQRAQRYSG